MTYPNGVDYLLRLPDEYQPGRSYPLLVALPDPNLDKGAPVLLERLVN